MKKKRYSPSSAKAKAIPADKVQDYRIESLTHDGRGVARTNGKVTFIEGALPGETVSARLLKSNRKLDQAVMETLITASPDRIPPLCSHYHQCGGCSFQHLQHASQIDAKADWLGRQLRRVAGDISFEFLESPAFGYRRRARLSVKQQKKGKVVCGFREKKSDHLIPLQECPVLVPELNALLPDLQNNLKSMVDASGVGHIELLQDDKGNAILLRLTSDLCDQDLALWRGFAEERNLVLYLQGKSQGKVCCDFEDQRQYKLLGMTLFYHPQDFVQVNGYVNPAMVEQALNWLRPGEEDRILDLFCGIGNFSLPLARFAGKVIGVEALESMVASARRNALENHLSNLSFVAADLTQADLSWLDGSVNKVLLDPPRAGAWEFLPMLLSLNVEEILYVSCDASTLARDAEYLVDNGFYVERVALMDMFPQTAHVETMMLLRNKKRSQK